MKKILLAFLLVAAACAGAMADTVSVAVNHFAVRENPFARDEVAIVATDSLGNIREGVNGSFLFTINGFQDTLRFNHGAAFYPHKITRSTFLFARHVNDAGSHSILYYVYHTADKITPVHISWILLIAIPCALFLLAYMFRRFIVVAIIIFAVFVFFNYHNGLTIPSFFGSIFDGLKSLF